MRSSGDTGSLNTNVYTYALLAANTNQTAEGTVGSPITESTTKILATIN